MFSDKTAHNIKMSKTITRYLQFIEELYEIVESNLEVSKIDRQTLESIHKKYQKIIKEHGRDSENSLHYKRRAVPIPLREYRFFAHWDKEPDKRGGVKDKANTAKDGALDYQPFSVYFHFKGLVSCSLCAGHYLAPVRTTRCKSNNCATTAGACYLCSERSSLAADV